MEIFRELKGKYGAISKDSVERAANYLVLTGIDEVDYASIIGLEFLRENLQSKIENDYSKYAMPENFKTSLVMTINARALQNFLELRSSKYALMEIQTLSKAIYDVLPENHKFLFDYIYEKENTNGI